MARVAGAARGESCGRCAPHPVAGSMHSRAVVVGAVRGCGCCGRCAPPPAAVGLLGTMFISALKAVAPVLVLVLVAASVANHRQGQDTRMRPILGLYLAGTVMAALVGVAASFLFPTTLVLDVPADAALSAPGGIGEVLRTLVLKVFDNPFNALVDALIGTGAE